MNDINQIHANLSHDCELVEKVVRNFLETIRQIIEEYERLQERHFVNEMFNLEPINIIPSRQEQLRRRYLRMNALVINLTLIPPSRVSCHQNRSASAKWIE